MTSTPTRQPLPTTIEQARRERPYWQDRLSLARIKRDVAQREFELACDDLSVVEATIQGMFSADPPIHETNHYGVTSYGYVQAAREHCIGSRGPWSWAL